MGIERTEHAGVGKEPIPGAGFESAAVAPADRFEAWRASMAPLQEIEPAPGTRGEPRVAAAGWALDDLLFGDLAFSPIAYRRRADRAGGRLLLRLYREGHGHGVYGETSFRTGPGEIHLFDQAPAARGLTADWHRLQSVFIPHGAVGYQPGRHPAHLRIAAGTAVGRVLCAAIEALFAELPRAGRAEAAALVPVFCGLVWGLLLTAAPAAAGAREFDAPRRLAMRRYLEERLGEPELGPARLCAAFGASRATVYRDFAEDGGVERFITRRRLERAYHELASGPPERGRVRRVAERWGFACPYHFSRAFRRQFDRWPSDVIETRRAADRGVPPGIVGKE